MTVQKHVRTSYIFITIVRKAGIFLYQYCTSFLRQREKVLQDTLKTNFGYIKFWVKIQPQSEKSYNFCWISINFVHQNLMKRLFFNEPEWLFFFFYSGWGSKISCKINAFLRIRSLHAFEKSIATITGSRVVCKYILSMASYGFKFHKWTDRLL